jgi:hypothetical protein
MGCTELIQAWNTQHAKDWIAAVRGIPDGRKGTGMAQHFFTNGYFKLSDLKGLPRDISRLLFLLAVSVLFSRNAPGEKAMGAAAEKTAMTATARAGKRVRTRARHCPPPEAIQRPQRAGLGPARRGRRARKDAEGPPSTAFPSPSPSMERGSPVPALSPGRACFACAAETPAAGALADACSGRNPRSGRAGRRLLGQKPPQWARGQTLFSPSHTSGDAVAVESLSAMAWGGKRMLRYNKCVCVKQIFQHRNQI